VEAAVRPDNHCSHSSGGGGGYLPLGLLTTAVLLHMSIIPSISSSTTKISPHNDHCLIQGMGTPRLVWDSVLFWGNYVLV